MMEMIKLTILIKEKNASNLVSIWKLLLGFVLEIEKK